MINDVRIWTQGCFRSSLVVQTIVRRFVFPFSLETNEGIKQQQLVISQNHPISKNLSAVNPVWRTKAFTALLERQKYVKSTDDGNAGSSVSSIRAKGQFPPAATSEKRLNLHPWQNPSSSVSFFLLELASQPCFAAVCYTLPFPFVLPTSRLTLSSPKARLGFVHAAW